MREQLKTIKVISLIIIMMTYANTVMANDCPFIPPDSSPGWQNFHTAVQNEYGGIPSSDRGQSLIYGHAMGRMEEAVNGDPERAVDLACVKRKLEQDFLNNAIMGNLGGFDGFWQKRRHRDDIIKK